MGLDMYARFAPSTRQSIKGTDALLLHVGRRLLLRSEGVGGQTGLRRTEVRLGTEQVRYLDFEFSLPLEARTWALLELAKIPR